MARTPRTAVAKRLIRLSFLKSQEKSITRAMDDPLLPYIRSIHDASDEYRREPDASATHFISLLQDCIRRFSSDDHYRDDPRFLKIWILYADAVQDFERVFRMLEVKGICQTNSLLYGAYAIYLVAKGKLLEAHDICVLGIFSSSFYYYYCSYCYAYYQNLVAIMVPRNRNAEPRDRLKKMQNVFLNHLGSTIEKVAPSNIKVHRYINPWSSSTIDNLLMELDTQLKKFNGYYRSKKAYSGKTSLVSLESSSRNKIIELGGSKYQITGRSGSGGFAQVYKAYIDFNVDDVVSVKIQRPPFPWEFYMYRQLDLRISDVERSSFGFAHRVHIFSDWSILICDYISHGTLQDAINSYLVMEKSMEEVLCIYYTIEMLRMLEALHNTGIIHGDFKPDNLLIRYARDDLTDNGFITRSGSWHQEGLCLVDWGRGIDMNLFPAGTEFSGDNRTTGFRCIEMQEKKPWTYQVDTYGLCVVVHTMLYGAYMTVERFATPDGSYHYLPINSFKRYWNAELWRKLFSSLLNVRSNDSDTMLLRSLRKSFEDYLCYNPQLLKKLRHLLVKQKAWMCSS